MWVGIAALLVGFSVPQGITKTPLWIDAPDAAPIEAVEYRADAAVHRRTVILIGDGTDGTHGGAIDELAEALFNRGLDVVTWDKRGTGGSAGRWDYGASDAADLYHVVEAIDRRTFSHEIGLLGIGTGGIAAFDVAARTARIRALAVYGVGIHGVPADPGAWLGPDTFSGRLWLWLQGVHPVGGAEAGAVAAFDMREVLQRMHRRPVFFSVGGRDGRVSRDDARALFEAARAPKEWGFAPGAGERPPVEKIAGGFADFFTRRLR